MHKQQHQRLQQVASQRLTTSMGRQIHFYMLPEDQSAFLQLVVNDDPVWIASRDSDSADVQPLTNLDNCAGQTLSFWNRGILGHLEREALPMPGRYRIDTLRTPTLEFTPSFASTWEARPALGQGRLYGIFDAHLGKPQAFQKWYESLVRWIRKNYRKNPTSMGGYVGPAAYEFYSKGGYLLPEFLPPRTEAWLDEIAKQHSRAPKISNRRGRERSQHG